MTEMTKLPALEARNSRTLGHQRDGEEGGGEAETEVEMDKMGTMEDTRGEVVEAAEEVVLPGFRFHPTDEELIGFYLRRKVEKKPLKKDIIRDIDIYKYDPWDLPRLSNVGDKESYFFCQRGRKYRNSVRPNRVTCSGFWKATGIDRPVYSSGGSNNCIGLKKSLVYYRGSAGKGIKSDWMMHEFRLPSGGGGKSAGDSCIQEAETWTICRILKRNISYKKHVQCSKDMQSRQLPSDSNNSLTYSGESTNSVITYLEDKSQVYGGQWNPSAQPPSATTYPDFSSSNSGDFVFEEGCWDELARIVECSVDPSDVYEYCRYSCS